MTHPLTSVFRSALGLSDYGYRIKEPNAVSSEVATTIIDFTDRLPDDALLSALAEAPGLTGTARDRIAQHPKAVVTTVFLSRDDLTVDEMNAALTSEKRVTVLAALAQSATATPDLLARLAGHPHHKVAFAALANDRTPDDARVAAATVCVAWIKLSEDNRRAAAEVMAATDDADPFLAVFADAAHGLPAWDAGALDAAAAGLCCTAGASPSAVQDWIRARVPFWVDRLDPTKPGTQYEVGHVLGTIAQHNFDPETTSVLAEVAEPIVSGAHLMAYKAPWVEALTRNGRPDQSADHIARLRRLNASTDPVELAAATDAVLTEDPSPLRDAVVTTLVTNPHLVQADTLRLVPVTPAAALCPILQRVTDVETVLAVFHRTPAPVLSSLDVAGPDNRSAVMFGAAQIAAMATTDAASRAVVVHHLVAQPDADLNVLRQIPWPALTEAASQWHPKVCDRVIAEVAAVRSFGDTAAVFDELSRDFDGTFGDLCELVRNLTVDEAQP